MKITLALTTADLQKVLPALINKIDASASDIIPLLQDLSITAPGTLPLSYTVGDEAIEVDIVVSPE